MTAAQLPRSAVHRTAWSSPLVLLPGALVLVAAILSWPVSAPIGPMYWDVFIYYDAANRIFSGQLPIVDFFAPVGPLGYGLFAGWLKLFPDGQPALMAHWSMLAVTVPLMAIVTVDVDRRSRAIALALVVPFLFYALLPFNNREFYPFPGSDAFGIYNRQVCHLLYVLVCALLFMRSGRALAVVVSVVMAALFFTKITGFVAGGLIAAFAVVSGRLAFRYAAAAAIAFLAVMAILEATTSMVSIYIVDILALVFKNSGTLAPRFLQALSQSFGVIAPAVLLALLALAMDRRRIALDHPGLWLLVVLAAGIFFETQNTGSQALIFLWPVVLALGIEVAPRTPRPIVQGTFLLLAAATVLPTAVTTLERAVRTYVGALRNVPLPNENLKSLGNVSIRPDFLDRAKHMEHYYAEHDQAMKELAAVGELPTYLLYSDFDFQATHLMTTDRAIAAIERLEADRNVHFDTMMTLSFVNVFPWLMDRQAPLHIAIGADPFRAVPDPGAAQLQAVRDVDIVLYPKCPETTATATLLALYAPALTAHRRVRLDDCYDAFVNPRFSLGN